MSRRAHRQAIVALLQASSPVIALVPAANIFDSRSTAIPRSSIPAVVIDTDQTIRRRESGHQLPTFKVIHQMILDIFAEGSTDAAASAAADGIAEVVGEALLTDPDFLDRFESVSELTEQMAWDSGSDARRRLVRMRFEAQISACYEPTVADDFSELAIELDMIDPGDGPDGEIEAEITLEDLET